MLILQKVEGTLLPFSQYHTRALEVMLIQTMVNNQGKVQMPSPFIKPWATMGCSAEVKNCILTIHGTCYRQWSFCSCLNLICIQGGTHSSESWSRGSRVERGGQSHHLLFPIRSVHCLHWVLGVACCRTTGSRTRKILSLTHPCPPEAHRITMLWVQLTSEF